MPCVHIVNPQVAVRNMFEKRGWEVVTQFSDKIDLIQFTCGEDVDPAYYGEAKHATTRTNSKRDSYEANLYYNIKDLYPVAGICRGGQLLNVLCGGSMWQHVDNHLTCVQHPATFYDKEMLVTSDHHQMMKPTDKAEILGTSRLSTFRETATETNLNEDFVDIECVYYPNGKGVLCFQPRPEWVVDDNYDCQQLYFNLLEERFGLV